MKGIVKYLVVLALLPFTKLHAQSFAIGAEGEIITSSVKIGDIPNSAIKAVHGKDIMGYAIGPYAKLSFGSLYIKPKLLVSHQSGTSSIIYPDGDETDVDISVTKLDIPVLIGLKIAGPLSIEAGPVYNRILSVTEDYHGESVDIKTGGLGYRVGANLQFSFVGFNVSYQGIKNGSSSSLSSFETPDELIFGLSLGF